MARLATTTCPAHYPIGCLPMRLPARLRDVSDDRTIAYAGEPGAFAEDAVLASFGDVERIALGSFREVFDAVAGGTAAAGVIPIENVINGTVRENYDLLLEFDLVIRGEVVVPVRLCLAALPGQRLADIERVYSHIQALGQAEAFLRQRPWQLLTTYNTAGAGKAIVDRRELGAAAVLSPRAAGLFGLEILADEIGDLPGNRTRFLVIGRTDGRGTRPRWRATGTRGPRSSSRSATNLARSWPSSRSSPITGSTCTSWSRGHPGSVPGSTCFWVDLDADVTRRRHARRVRAPAGRHHDDQGPRELPGGRRSLTARPDERPAVAGGPSVLVAGSDQAERLRSSSRISVRRVSSAGGRRAAPP